MSRAFGTKLKGKGWEQEESRRLEAMEVGVLGASNQERVGIKK